VAKPKFQTNAKIRAIFNDLEQYLDFCRNYGYVYNESDLYNWKSYAFQQFNKQQQGKTAKDMWSLDSQRSKATDR
jgi:hypothetical protein